MAFISYNKLWESEFHIIVSKGDKLQTSNINQLKLEVHDSYQKNEKITTIFERSDDSDIINKAFLDEKFLETDGHLSFLEKLYNEFILQYNKQSVGEVFFQRAVKTTIQRLYDKCLFDDYANGDKVLEDFFLPLDVGVIYQSK